jgi:phage terminase large subunit GpA-like protein
VIPSPHARAAAIERRVLRTVFQPPPRMRVDEWADAHRYLSPEASAEPGKYETSRAPYQREPMAALSDPRVRQVVLMWPSQVGKTEILNNFVGHRVDQMPGPMLVLQPTLQMGEAWSKDRLAPMLRDCPSLRGKVKDARSRDSNNTLLHKVFPGGHITIAGANSPAGLASRPIRDVLCDEVDRYNISAGTEGDPIGLAFRRASTFRNGKKILISSPTVAGRSRIAKEFEESTKERWHVPCPHCGTMQILVWGGRDTAHGIKWDDGRPETAYYVCTEGCVVEEMHKAWMNGRGKWVAEQEHATTRGFWMNALASPWVPWGDLVREFLTVKNDAYRLGQFVNTVLCELWEEGGEQIEVGSLLERCQPYAAQVPAGAAVLTRAVDVQGDRLETAVWAFGEGEESWLIDAEIIPGDPGTPAPWLELEKLLAKGYTHASGTVLRPRATFIDSGGHHATQVYGFTRPRQARGVYATKGSSVGDGAPLVGRPSRNNAQKAILYMIGAHTGKEAFLSRLAKNRTEGPGFVHLPDWVDSEQLAQLTAEKLVTRIVGGRPKRTWVKTRDRNEQLDLAVLCLAALHSLGPGVVRSLGAGAAQMNAQAQPKPQAKPDPLAPLASQPTPRRGGGGFATGGKKWRVT